MEEDGKGMTCDYLPLKKKKNHSIYILTPQENSVIWKNI